LLYLIVAAAGLAGLCWFVLIHNLVFGRRLVVAQRLDEVRGAARATVRQRELSRPFYERVLRPVWRRLAAGLELAPPGRAGKKLLQKLERAGKPGGLAPEEVLALRYAAGGALAVVGGISGLVLTAGGLPVVVASLLGFIGGWLGVDAYLRRAAARRRERLTAQLPNALDLLTVSVEAGLGFEGALLKVAEKMPGELADEFGRALREIQMGKPRREAMRDMAARADTEDVHTFVGAIITAEQFGVGIADVLREQAANLRHKRRYRAQETAMRAPVKMLFPLIFLIFPALITVLLGPAVIRMVDMFR